MKKLYLLSAMVLSGITPLIAAPLSPEQSLGRVSQNGPLRLGGLQGQPELVMTVDGNDNLAALYVFDRGNNGGFMVVSADDVAAPLLGYTDNGSLDLNNLPPALEYWLNEYAKEISYARANGMAPYNKPSLQADEVPVGPLLTTLWDQDVPYNNDCNLTSVTGSNIKCVTGCVATAMAQVMNYHKYPEVGQGEITYQPYSNVLPLTLDFSAQKFDWDNMLDTYVPGNYNEEEAAAVAYLMKACGYSVSMTYSPQESLSNSYLIMDSMSKYFKYSGEFYYRECFSLQDWSELIYDFLAKTGPVLYNGTGPMGGHSFVCDGYSEDGYFHFNWGWSGLADGYYLLTALNPTQIGIGGGLGQFNDTQCIILPIPSTESYLPARVVQYGSLTGSITGFSLSLQLDDYDTLGWNYNGGGSHVFNFGIMIEETGGSGEPQYVATSLKNQELAVSKLSYRWPLMAYLSDAEMITGKTYKVTLVTSKADEETPHWVPVLPFEGYYNYIYVLKTARGYSIVSEEVKGLEVNGFEIPEEASYDTPFSYYVTISNPSEFELSKVVNINFVDSEGVPAYTFDNATIYVNPGQTVTQKITANRWYNIDGYPVIQTPASFCAVLYDVDNEGQEIDMEFPMVTVYPYGEGPDTPEVPRWNAVPSPGQLETNELASFSINWGSHNLQLLDASGVSFSSEAGSIAGLNVSLENFTDAQGYTFENGQLVVKLPAVIKLSAETEYKVIIAPGTVNILLEDENVENTEVAFTYITGGNAGIESLSTDGTFIVYSLDGVLLLNTQDLGKVKELGSGLYVINGRKVYLP